MTATGDAFDSISASAEVLYAQFDLNGNTSFRSFLGGTHNDEVRDMDIAPDGASWVTGVTNSPDFPVSFGSPTSPSQVDFFLVQIRNFLPLLQLQIDVDTQFVAHVNVRNIGNGDAANIVVDVRSQPKMIDLVSSPTPGVTVVDANHATWNVGSIAPNGEKTTDLTMRTAGLGLSSLNAIATTASLPGLGVTASRQILNSGPVVDLAIAEVPPPTISTAGRDRHDYKICVVGASAAPLGIVQLEVQFNASDSTLVNQDVRLNFAGNHPPERPHPLGAQLGRWIVSANLEVDQVGLPTTVELDAPTSLISSVTAKINPSAVTDLNACNNTVPPCRRRPPIRHSS